MLLNTCQSCSARVLCWCSEELSKLGGLSGDADVEANAQPEAPVDNEELEYLMAFGSQDFEL